MALEVGRIYRARRIGVRDGVPLFEIVSECKTGESWATNLILPWQRAGVRSSVPVGGIMMAPCAANGDLEVGTIYPARRIGVRNGVPVFEVVCEDCGEVKPTFCECEICCTLEATVQFPDSFVLPSAFGTPVDATLTCDGTFDITNVYVCNEIEIPENQLCVKVEQTWEGGSGSYVVGSQTFNWTTTVWVSGVETGGPAGLGGVMWADSVTYTGNFKVYFAATEYTITEEGEDDIICCAYEYGLLVEYEFDEISSCTTGMGTGWGFYFRTGFVSAGGCPDVKWTVEACPDFDNDCCPEGYFGGGTPGTAFLDATACDSPAFGYVTGNVINDSGCIFATGPSDPLLIDEEYWYRLSTDPDDDAHRIKCAKFMIFDLCDEEGGSGAFGRAFGHAFGAAFGYVT